MPDARVVMSMLDIGVILPTSTPDPSRHILGDVTESARFAEELGLKSVWSTDHLVASAPILDSTVVLASAAAATEHILVGFNVLILALRPVAWAAKQISTLQYVSGDRLLLGVGTGNPAHGDAGWRAAGVPFEGRGTRTDEALHVLPGLVRGEPVTFRTAPRRVSAPAPPCRRCSWRATAYARAGAPPGTETAGYRSHRPPRSCPRGSVSSPTSPASTGGRLRRPPSSPCLTATRRARLHSWRPTRRPGRNA